MSANEEQPPKDQGEHYANLASFAVHTKGDLGAILSRVELEQMTEGVPTGLAVALGQAALALQQARAAMESIQLEAFRAAGPPPDLTGE